MSFTTDNIFDQPQPVVDFRFDERTVAVFADMIHRSIPGYASLLQMTAVVAGQFVQHNDHIYDLGCSLGGVSLAIKKFVPTEVQITAVDLSSAMVARLQAYIAGTGVSGIEVLQADINTLALQPAKLIVLNFVLQFIEPVQRDALLAKIYATLPAGGALLIAEKTRPQKDCIRQWHEAFKRVQGYSELAIAQKRESLENVMKTDTTEVIENRLRHAGFKEIVPYFQGLSFKAWAAVK